MITAKSVRQALRYEPHTGLLFWKKSRGGVAAGSIAGWLHGNGYWMLGFGGKNHLAHRLIWLLVTGRHPKNEIDHKNRVRHDNRFLNLREATRSQNHQNRPSVMGACWHKHSRKFRAVISIKGTVTTLGYFETPEEARAVYLAAKKKFHPFART